MSEHKGRIGRRLQAVFLQCKKRKSKLSEQWRKISGRFRRDYEGTERPLYFFGLFLFMLTAGVWGKDLWRPKAAAFLAAAVLALLAAVILEWVFRQAVRLLGRNGSRGFYIRILFLFLLALVITPDITWTGETQVLLALFLFLVLWLAVLWIKSFWAIVWNRVRNARTVIPFLGSGCAVILLLVFLISPGLSDKSAAYRLSLRQEGKEEELRPEEKEAFQSYRRAGEYTVGQIDYGAGEGSLASETADIRDFASNEGLTGKLKEAYQGYTLERVPLRGRIWYPRERENCETIFLAHGNHIYTEDSYLGYSYLGEYLASYGYVVVSVDENSCNVLSNENDARAVLLLENMRQVETYNAQEGCVLYHKMNFNKLALAGHSRGGEMIADAFLFNQSLCYPDNGTIRFSYHFTIRSLFAIAPSVNQYMPSGRDVELSDVNYFVLYGANDQDVVDFMGMRQYQHVTFSGRGDYLKGSVVIDGMNHGQFNERWGKYDLMAPMGRALHVKNFMAEEQQQWTAKLFAKIFFDVTLREDDSCRSFLSNVQAYQEFLPASIYVQTYQASHFIPIMDCEEDARLDTGTLAGSRIFVRNVASYKEKLLFMPSGDSLANHVLSLRWSKKKPEEQRAEIEISLPGKRKQLTVEEDRKRNKTKSREEWTERGVLSFDIMDQEEYVLKDQPELWEGTVALQDANGETAQLKLSDYAGVYPDLPVYLNKFSRLFGWKEYEHNMQTVRMPLSDFAEQNPDFSIGNVVKIRFLFPQNAGFPALDRVGIDPGD